LGAGDLATHRPSLLKVMDKVLVLNNGTVERFGPVAEVRETSSGARSASCALPAMAPP